MLITLSVMLSSVSQLQNSILPVCKSIIIIIIIIIIIVLKSFCK